MRRRDKNNSMIYDISKEIFSTEIYPGDPVPAREFVMSFEKEEPDVCQLTELTLGSHTGTHMDAPRHFFKNGKTMAELDLSKCIGPCQVLKCPSKVSREILESALRPEEQRLLLKGARELDEGAAEFLVERGILCIGVESLSVAPLSSPVKVHKLLLGAEIIILEGLVLEEVPEGRYELIALPLKMEGLDGSPVRAVLRELTDCK